MHSEVHTWASKLDIPVDESALPLTYCEVPGLARVYLYHTQSSVTYVDSLIVNPELSACEKHKAVTELLTRVIRENTGKLLVFYSTNKAICAIINRQIGPKLGTGDFFVCRS